MEPRPSRASTTGTPRPVGELEAGDVLDRRYRLVKRIGRGGFGDVWRAVELLPDGAPLRDVALKLLSPEMADSSWSEEAKLLASFSHPSLVTIYAAGQLEDVGAPFVAMELLLGESLAEVVKRRGTIPWRTVLRYGREVAAALDVIHARGVVHLDLKPANLFVTDEGAVKVLDFGIARTATTKTTRERVSQLPVDGTMATAMFILESSDPFAATQRAESGEVAGEATDRVVIGTPGFVAPEVLQFAEPTMFADAYALGVTLAVLATGTLPHAVTHEPMDDANMDELRAYMIELRDATLAGKLDDLSQKGFPAGFAGLIARLCAVDPARRCSDKGGLRAVLDEAWARPHGVPKQPYPGLRALGPKDEGLIFGRDEDLARALRHLSFEMVLAVAGPLGAGKTSFVSSLLLPELQKGKIDRYHDAHVVAVEPGGEDPDASLERALSSLDPKLGGAEDVLRALGDFARGGQEAVVVFLDELEKIASAPAERRRRTVGLIHAALRTGRTEGVRVVLAIDQDAVETLSVLDADLATLPTMARYLAPPPEAMAEEVALGPARLVGWSVTSTDVVKSAMAAELARGGVVLPAIAIVLAEWAREAKGGALDGARLGARGGVAGALHRRADAALAQLDVEARAVVDALLMRLATTEGKLVAVAEADLLRRAGDAARAGEVLSKLKVARIVRSRGGAVELSHPALASWPHLVSVRLGAMDRLAFRERLAEAALAWEKAGQRSDYLDRGELSRDLKRHGDALHDLTGLEAEYLAASRRARRRNRITVGGLTLLAFATVVAVLVGREALERRRVEAEAREKAAVEGAHLAGLVARARQTMDPYERVAFYVEASRKGSREPALALELLGAAHDLPPGRFLSLEAVDRPQMPWDDRWVVGRGASGALVVFDLKSKTAEPEVMDHLDVELDPEQASVVFRTPKRFELDAGGAPVVEITPLRYDTAVLARNTAGQVRLFRLTPLGDVALAAVSPLVCRGELSAATNAPVVGCVGDKGIALWDFGANETRVVEEPAGAIAVSPDGRSVAAWTGADLAVHRPFESGAEPKRTVLPAPAALAAFSPRDQLLAIALPKGLRVVDGRDPATKVFETTGLPEPAAMRWDDGGLDVALCSLGKKATWFYLRPGKRSLDDPAPRGGCGALVPGAPRFMSSRFDLGPFGMRDFGEHFSRGAFVLPKDRLLSTTLVLAGTTDDGLERVIKFRPRGTPTEEKEPKRGIAKLVRQGPLVALEMSRTGAEVDAQTPPPLLLVDAKTSKRSQSTRAFLLGACPDGRVFGYTADGAHYRIVDVRGTTEVAQVPRAAGLVIGLSPSCTKLYLQHLDGAIHAALVEPGASSKLVLSAQGYVFLQKPSRAFDGGNAGTIVALSSGEVVRIDEKTDEARLVARGSPRASAISDGASPGEVLFADDLGVHRVRRDGGTERVGRARPDAPFEDLAVTRDGRALVLASAASISVLDLATDTTVGSAPIKGMTRLEPWGDDGTLAAYAPDLDGIHHALLVPFGPTVIEAVGTLASNLRVDERGALILKR